MGGTVKSLKIESDLLHGARGTSEHVRPVLAYIPDSGQDAEKLFPVLFILAPWTGAGRSQFDWKPFREGLVERFDRLILRGKMAPAVVVSVDLFTSFGGSQYINSYFFGPHGDHICEELIPFCERELPILKGPDHRGVFGRSSGGYGALRLALDYPGVFGAVACHSGDLGFDLMFGGDLPDFCSRLARYRDVNEFLEYTQKAHKISGGDIHLLMLLGMAGFYSPNLHEPNGYDLPVDLHDGVINQKVWSRWLEHDPVRIIDRRSEGLRDLKYLYIECGLKDQYNLLFGARQFHSKLQGAKIRHRYEEFNDNHSGTEYRYDISMPEMVRALQPGA